MNVEHALILCGGKSSRMNKEKASLYYYGEAQYKRVYTLLAKCFRHVFFSVAHANVAEYLLSYPHITDIQKTRCGPMLGIVSAFDFCAVPWFVLAIDMPNVTEEAIMHVLHTRNNYKENNAVLHATLVCTSEACCEPLFAVYETKIQQHLNTQFAKKQYSLQKLLKQESWSICKVAMNADVVKNINTYEEYQHYTM